jgi:hypothetical protein
MSRQEVCYPEVFESNVLGTGLTHLSGIKINNK